MNVKITPRKPGEADGIVCLPITINIPVPKSKDWKKVSCPKCGADCWESDLARQVISGGAAVACTMCALKAGLGRDNKKE